MSDLVKLSRIEAAMAKVAKALPDDPSLGPVWNRLEAMWHVAKAAKAEETAAQASARLACSEHDTRHQIGCLIQGSPFAIPFAVNVMAH